MLLVFVVPSTKDGVRAGCVAVVRSSYLAGDPPIRRRRKYRVPRFDLRTLGHNHGTTAANGVSPFPVFGVYEDFDDDADGSHTHTHTLIRLFSVTTAAAAAAEAFGIRNKTKHTLTY